MKNIVKMSAGEDIMKNINFQRTVEIRDSVDVFVVGGGPAGVASAVAAARNGAKVFLAEKSQCFGGMGTIAKVPAFMRFSDGVNFLAGGIGGGNIGHVFGVDGTDERSITAGIIDARRRMPEYQRYYNEYLPGYEKAKIIATADILGIRETRRIVCEYNMTLEDYFKQADFEDEIGRYCYPVDIHASAPDEVSKYPDIYENGYEKGKSYGIPFRSLLPKKTENIIVAGRCIGAEREMMGSVRVMPACYITGQAAGTAAAMSALSGTGLRELDIHDLQHKLVKEGAFLPNFQA